MPATRFLRTVSYGTTRRIGCAMTMALALGACGYKGPLYMPPPPPAPDASLTTPPATPDNTALTPPPATPATNVQTVPVQ